MANPSTLLGSPATSDLGTRFYVDMYGVRSLVLAAGLMTASLTIRRAPTFAAIVIGGGGLVQLGDAAIAVHLGTPGVVGASIAAAIHLASASFLLRSTRHPHPSS
ncbi:hypothetical protein B7R22_01975 [Subtercola boreus]|uniref:Uncharacterized protein n=1 Tax=Subtercola boreus TaxID=120213 RepID=A0A3E0W5Q5_9MICO|nr:hypothetical protein [Subtercola boreus]RFA17079.1 hypothetical protein B7R22_01975 [Subtercola boreus]